MPFFFTLKSLWNKPQLFFYFIGTLNLHENLQDQISKCQQGHHCFKYQFLSQSIYSIICESNTVQVHKIPSPSPEKCVIYSSQYLYDNQKRLWEKCEASHDQEVFLKGGFVPFWCKDLKRILRKLST